MDALMTAEVNRQLYSQINVLRTWHPEHRRCAPEAYISRVPLQGFSPVQQPFYVSPRLPFKYDDNTLRTLTVPGDTQTNTITIDLAAGGHIVRWLHSNADNETPLSLVNLFGSQGRGVASTLVWFEHCETYNITSIDVISPATTTVVDGMVRVTLDRELPFEPGKRFKAIIAGVVDADEVPVAAINVEFLARASLSGSDYRNAFWVDVDISAVTGPTGGTMTINMIHNPTQSGSAVGIDPSVAPDDDNNRYEKADHVFNQNSVLVRKPVLEMIGSNQGYIETSVIPLEFNPDGEATGWEHGGSKYTPVLWTGFEMKTQIWINFEGQEGVHKMTTTIYRKGDMIVGQGMPGYEWLSQNHDIHWNYNLGLASGNPKAKAVTAGGPEDSVTVFGDDYLDAIDWPNVAGGGGKYWRPTTGANNLIMLPGYAIRTPGGGVNNNEGTTVTGSDNPWNEFGGALVIVGSDESVAAGVWKTTNDSPATLASASSNSISGEGYTADDNGVTPMGISHHINADTGLNTLRAGNATVTSWIVTGTPSALFDNSAAFFQNMLERGYY